MGDAFACEAKPSVFHMGTHDELIAAKGTYYRLYTGAFELE